MADIKQYTDQIAQAIYGKDVRDSIVNALEKVNNDNNSYQEIKEQVLNSQTEIKKSVDDFESKVESARQISETLETSVESASDKINNLNTVIPQATTVKNELAAIVDYVQENLSDGDTATYGGSEV